MTNIFEMAKVKKIGSTGKYGNQPSCRPLDSPCNYHPQCCSGRCSRGKNGWSVCSIPVTPTPGGGMQ